MKRDLMFYKMITNLLLVGNLISCTPTYKMKPHNEEEKVMTTQRYCELLDKIVEDEKGSRILCLNHVYEVKVTEINKIEQREGKIDKVKVSRMDHLQQPEKNFTFETLQTYNMQYFKPIREGMEELIYDLRNNDQLDETEKILVVLRRICQDIYYDKAGLQQEKLSQNEYIKDTNLENAILKGKGMCGGYAVVFFNAMTGLGIESREIWGIVKTNEGEIGHAWNQVKVDGKWYNIDITNIYACVHQNKQEELAKIWEALQEELLEEKEEATYLEKVKRLRRGIGINEKDLVATEIFFPDNPELLIANNSTHNKPIMKCNSRIEPVIILEKLKKVDQYEKQRNQLEETTKSNFKNKLKIKNTLSIEEKEKNRKIKELEK